MFLLVERIPSPAVVDDEVNFRAPKIARPLADQRPFLVEVLDANNPAVASYGLTTTNSKNAPLKPLTVFTALFRLPP